MKKVISKIRSAGNQVQFWSGSSMKIRSLEMESLTRFGWSSMPWVTVLMHSYSSDMAGVLLIRLVSGSTSFFDNLGSRGVRDAN